MDRSESPKSGATDLPSPEVASSEYDATYYLYSCNGSDEWRESGGRSAKGLYAGALAMAGLKPGEALLDIGTGRAEILPAALNMGASKALGVDYSAAAIELAQKTLAAAGHPEGATALLADSRRLPVDDSAFDLVTMLDVVEHLNASELDVSLREAYRALKPGGRVFIHTAPNRLVYDVTYRTQRRLWPGRASRWPADPRDELERRMHVNEQTLGSLARALSKSGFGDVRVSLGRWIHADFVPDLRARRVYGALSRVPGLRRFAIFDLFATATRTQQGTDG